jgi:hypothetical protein
MNSLSKMKPSPALVLACVALAVALSGTSYAAFVLPAHSVGAKQLKKSAVTRKKIATGAVTGAKVKNDSLTGADILEPRLGKVSSAAQADSATNAANAAHATAADGATHADSATNAANASALNGYAANGLTRVARMLSAAIVTLSIIPQSYGTKLSITAPAPGFVLVTGSLTATASATCTTGCNVEVWIHHMGGSDYSMGASGSVSNYATNRFANLAPTDVFPVAAGVNTFELSAVRDFGDGTLEGVRGSLSALYSPFGSTGGSTLGAGN